MAPKMAFFKFFTCFGVKQKEEKHQSPASTPEEATKAPGRVSYIVDVVMEKVERFDSWDKKVLFTKRNKDIEVQNSFLEFGWLETQEFVNEGDLTLEDL